MANSRTMARDYRKGCYSTKDLMARGWSRTLIKKLLGKPDYVHDFGFGRCAYLYIPIRVSAAENKEEFQKRRKQDGNRSNERPKTAS